MNRTFLIGLVLAVGAAAAVCGRASADTPPPTEGTSRDAAGELEVRRNAWLECVRAAIPRLDHFDATSEAVARAAMNTCSDQYTAMLGALSHTLVPSCGQDSDCTRNALAKAGREATRTATNEVVTARIRVAGARVLECQ